MTIECSYDRNSKLQRVKVNQRMFSLLIGLFSFLLNPHVLAQIQTSQSLDVNVTASGIVISPEQSGLSTIQTEALRNFLERRVQSNSFVDHGGQLNFHVTGPLLHELDAELSRIDTNDVQQVEQAVEHVVRPYEDLSWIGNFDETQLVIGRSAPMLDNERKSQLIVIGSEGNIYSDVDRAVIVGSRVNFMSNSRVQQTLATIGSQVTASPGVLNDAQRLDVVFPLDSKGWIQSLPDIGRDALLREFRWQSSPALFYGGIASLLLAFVLGALYLIVFPQFHRQTDNLLLAQKGKALGIGFMSYLLLILLLFLLAVTIIGIFLIPSLLFLFIVLSAMGYFTVASTIGRTLLQQYPIHDVWKFSLGLICLQTIGLIPWLGWLVVQTAAIAGFGAVLLAISTRFHFKPKRTYPQREPRPLSVRYSKRWKMPSSVR